jgi:MFS family permease
MSSEERPPSAPGTPVGTPRDGMASLRLVLANPGFRRVWATGALASAMRWLDLLVLGVFVFDLTGSAFKVALLFFFRMAPRLLLALPLGTLSDRVSRQRMLVVTFVALAVISAALGALVLSGRVEYWHLLICTFLTGIFWTTEFPVRRAMIGDVVPRELVGRAFAIDIGTSAVARMVGPLTGGALLQAIGAEAAFFTQAVVFVLATLVIASLRYTPPTRVGPPASAMAEMFEGLRYVRARQLLVGGILVSLLMNLFGFPYTAMVPVIGKETLGAAPLGVGLLQSAEGLGALIGAVLIATLASTHVYARLYVLGTGLFLAIVVVFSGSTTYALSVVLLFVAGFGMAAYTAMQVTLMVAGSAPEMRGRVMGAVSLSLGGNPIGALNVGILAGMFGAPIATAIMGVEGLAALALIAQRYPALRQPFALPEEAVPLPSSSRASEVPVGRRREG